MDITFIFRIQPAFVFIRTGIRSCSILNLKNQLKKRTDDAYNKGIFGAPSFLVNNKLFWGQDRIEFVLNEAKKDKPSKYPLLLALNKISLKPNKNIWYVGDNEIDVEFAKKNNCSSIFIENKMFKKKDLKQTPDLILKKIESLELYIK